MRLDNVIKALTKDKIVVLPTDTIYGVHASALSKKAVKRAYKVTKRSETKPFIILISSADDLEKFGIELDKKTKEFLENAWPSKLSVVLPCPSKKFEYLHKGTRTLAFRVPDKNELVTLLEQTGPLVSTSANPEGKKPATNIREAADYFVDDVDIYVDEGKLESEPSTVIRIDGGKINVLREGVVKIPQETL